MKPLTVMRVDLGAPHHHASRTQHATVGPSGIVSFPPFIRLEIASGDDGFYLNHICADGQVADTHHSTLDEALHQAEWECGVHKEDWRVSGDDKGLMVF